MLGSMTETQGTSAWSEVFVINDLSGQKVRESNIVISLVIILLCLLIMHYIVFDN